MHLTYSWLDSPLAPRLVYLLFDSCLAPHFLVNRYNYQLMQMDINETKTPVSAWVPLAKEGDVFRVDAWYDSPTNAFIEKVLAAAAAEEVE